jgi:hypothetical protein
MTTAEGLAKQAIDDWLDDGVEFCYIYEQYDARYASEDVLERARVYVQEMVDAIKVMIS